MNIEEEPRIAELTRTGELIGEQISTLKQRAEKNFPGTTYAIFWSHEEHQMVAAPPYLILTSPFSHSIDYGSGLFEGSSALINERTGIPHIILFKPRNDRLFNRSLPARLYQSPVCREEFEQAQLDFVAINGPGLFKDPNAKNTQNVRAYIRPTIHPAGLGGYGVSLKGEYPIDAAIITWPWPDYLSPSVYTKGMRAAITGHQRLSPVTGKHASNYGAAGMEGSLIRSFGIDELIYLARYLIDEHGHQYWADPNDHEAKLRDGVLADGPGEEIFAITADGKTMVYPPMRVNRLGGTVLEYVRTYMAPNLGIQTEERDITLRDIRAGKYLSLGMQGNAVKIAPVRMLQIVDNKGVVSEQIEFTISEPLIILMDRYDRESRGLIDPSHPSFTTPVDMARGMRIRQDLDNIFVP